MFDKNLSSKEPEKVTNYLKNRWQQINAIKDSFGYSNPLIIRTESYQILLFCDEYVSGKDQYCILYLYDDYRGGGKYKEIANQINQSNIKILTVEDCGLEDYLSKTKMDYICLKIPKAYKIISEYYGDKVAERSGINYMQHINEGIVWLRYNGCVFDIEAFTIHPIFQNGDSYKYDWTEYSASTISKAELYADVANSYLPKDYEKDPPKIPQKIKKMLAADKIQNYKDFLTNKNIESSKKEELEIYFEKWFKALNISKNKNYNSQILLKNLNKISLI